MYSNLRLQQKFICSLAIALSLFCSLQSQASAESEAYRRQVKFETDRAKDFRTFKIIAQKIEDERMSGIPKYKDLRAKQEQELELARQGYVEKKRREDAQKPTDEYIEQKLAAAAEKEAAIKEQQRREYKSVQLEIERAIANTRLNEAEEFQLD